MVDHTNFATNYSSEINSVLLRFNNKFVSGGFIASYSSTSINAFSDWTNETGNYAITGPNYQNYNNTGVNGYKWIAINVTSKKVGNRINLSNFKINGSYPNLEKFNNSGDNNEFVLIFHLTINLVLWKEFRIVEKQAGLTILVI